MAAITPFDEDLHPKRRYYNRMIVNSLRNVKIGTTVAKTVWMPEYPDLFHALENCLFLKTFVLSKTYFVKRSMKAAVLINPDDSSRGLMIIKKSYKERVTRYVLCEPWLLDHFFCLHWHIVSLAPTGFEVEARNTARVKDGASGEITLIHNHCTGQWMMIMGVTAEHAFRNMKDLNEPFPLVHGTPHYRDQFREIASINKTYIFDPTSRSLLRLMYAVNAYRPTDLGRLNKDGIMNRELINLMYSSFPSVFDSSVIQSIHEFIKNSNFIAFSYQSVMVQGMIVERYPIV